MSQFQVKSDNICDYLLEIMWTTHLSEVISIIIPTRSVYVYWFGIAIVNGTKLQRATDYIEMVLTWSKVLSRKKYLLCFMYMYRVRKMKRCTRRTLEYVIYMYITCWRSGLKNDLIYKVIFEVFHHTKSSETPYADYLH